MQINFIFEKRTYNLLLNYIILRYTKSKWEFFKKLSQHHRPGRRLGLATDFQCTTIRYYEFGLRAYNQSDSRLLFLQQLQSRHFFSSTIVNYALVKPVKCI